MRDIVLGRNSSVWRFLCERPDVASANFLSLSHSELGDFVFDGDDRVWVFAYSRKSVENFEMIDRLRRSGVRNIIYVGSSSSIVCSVSHCYEYPRVKNSAEKYVLSFPEGCSVTLGLVVQDHVGLPAGPSLVTTYDDLAAFMLNPPWIRGGGGRKTLFRQVERGFESKIESFVYHSYGHLLGLCGRWPCFLRPIDFLLRAVNYRWYGYTYLSNRLWKSMMTS